MIRSPLFWKVFATYAVLTLTSVVLLSVPTYFTFRQFELEQATSQLTQQLDTIAQLGPKLPNISSSSNDWLKDLADDPSIHLTLINQEGTVVARSGTQEESEDNLQNRPEVIQARSGLNPAFSRKFTG